jgi:crossover junction endodeoxyribonuclease RuvC
MRLLGIDPGTATVGYGVIDVDGDFHPAMVAFGVIKTPPTLPMAERLRIIYDDARELLGLYRPGVVVIEKLFAFRNVTNVITVAQARGVLTLAAHQAGCRLAEYTPMQVKQTITGYGRAQKPEIQEMVRDLLGLSAIPRPDDAADALAFALTHVQFLQGGGGDGLGDEAADALDPELA